MNEETPERINAASSDDNITNPSPRLPYSLFFRWLISLLLGLNGLFPLYFNLYNWHLLSEMAITDPIFHPAPFVIFSILSVASGVLLFRSSKWAVTLFATHLFGSIAYQLALKGNLPVFMLTSKAVEGMILWYMFSARTHGKLL